MRFFTVFFCCCCFYSLQTVALLLCYLQNISKLCLSNNSCAIHHCMNKSPSHSALSEIKYCSQSFHFVLLALFSRGHCFIVSVTLVFNTEPNPVQESATSLLFCLCSSAEARCGDAFWYLWRGKPRDLDLDLSWSLYAIYHCMFPETDFRMCHAFPFLLLFMDLISGGLFCSSVCSLCSAWVLKHKCFVLNARLRIVWSYNLFQRLLLESQSQNKALFQNIVICLPLTVLNVHL